jgi:hypothetical protein
VSFHSEDLVHKKLNAVLIVGSAPDAMVINSWDLSVFSERVAINNAWQISEGWSHLIYPEDFPSSRLPCASIQKGKQLITASDFVPQQNRFGGFVYAGGTMAFTAGYWALGALKPDLIAYVGCDMVYSTDETKASHFYGQGTADPLREDVTLQSLEAKSIRFMALAHENNCTVVNLSQQADSRLKFPRMDVADCYPQISINDLYLNQDGLIGRDEVCKALTAEKNLGYMVASGRYWECESDFDKSKLSDIDDMWIKVKRDSKELNSELRL